MKTKPEFKVGDRVVFIDDVQKRGVVSRVFRLGGLWWLEFEGKSRASPDPLNRIPRRLSGLLPGLVLCNFARGA
jgi:hypothetical protein